jgi:hypothetical protein
MFEFHACVDLVGLCVLVSAKYVLLMRTLLFFDCGVSTSLLFLDMLLRAFDSQAFCDVSVVSGLCPRICFLQCVRVHTYDCIGILNRNDCEDEFSK